MEKNSVGLRKGIWTPEEDIMLRKCIENYGEGKWHLVPLRAGLNRCRKSCRLRWLNYLKPNIRRGQFSKDEVDLIIRLHKLLGNRWSLIAGRLPGRTANDVKNFWNTHIEKKQLSVPAQSTGRSKLHKTITQTTIVRPQPRTFSHLQLLHGPPPPLALSEISHPTNVNVIEFPNSQLLPSSSHGLDECMRWWSNSLKMPTIDNGVVADDEHHQTEPNRQHMSGELHDVHNPDPQGQGEVDGLSDFSIDLDIWELLSFEDER